MPVSWSELSFVGQITLILLLVLSFLSWGLIVEKFIRFRQSKRHYPLFIGRLSSIGNWNDWYSIGQQYSKFPSGRTIKKMSERAEREPDSGSLERFARIIGEEELSKAESGLPMLATIGSTSPFIGLFGTVWGIIDAFVGIGRYGSPNLAVVARGIAEALVCTAAGLVVAIPAVVGYNFFVARVRDEARRIEQAVEYLLVFHRRAAAGVR